MTTAVQPDMEYSPRSRISKRAFLDAGLYSGPVDCYHGEDYFGGMIGKTQLQFSEVHAESEHTTTDSEGNTTTHTSTIFQGLLTIVDFNKDFRSWVTISPDFGEGMFGWLGRMLQGVDSDLVSLENPEFEQAFVVHGGDQVEARYLLTLDMQERLLQLREWFGDDIRMSLRNSQLHLTVPKTSDWFEPSFSLPAHDVVQMLAFLRQMSAVFGIVEMLDLNTRIWTKE